MTADAAPVGGEKATPHRDRAVPTLPMRDLDETRDFYESVGFETAAIYAAEGYLMVELDGIELHFFHFPEIDPKGNYAGAYVYTAALEDAFAAFEGAGATILHGIEDKPWGQREFAVTDPNGNLLRIGNLA